MPFSSPRGSVRTAQVRVLAVITALAAGAAAAPPAQATTAAQATITGARVDLDAAVAKVRLRCPAEATDGCPTELTGTAAGRPLRTGSTTEGPRIYQGAMVDGRAPEPASFAPEGPYTRFEQQAGKGMAMIHWGQPWVMNGRPQRFQRTYFDAVREHGSIPVINWSSTHLGQGREQRDFQLRDVYEGHYDEYIDQWARDAAAWGHPFMLRFNHEMNGWWYPWGEGITDAGKIINGNRPGDYVRAWRHVHDRFVAAGATNVTWVWSPNWIGRASRFAKLRQVYPGDAYVDWAGLSAYNRDPRTWLWPRQLLTGDGVRWLRNSYAELLEVAPRKPIMIAEIATREASDGGARKAEWFRRLYRVLPQEFPRVKAVMYFDWPLAPWTTLPIGTSSAAVAAFRRAIGSPTYADNRYGALAGTPIPRSRVAAAQVNYVPLTPGSRQVVRIDLAEWLVRKLREVDPVVEFTATTRGSDLPPATFSAVAGD